MPRVERAIDERGDARCSRAGRRSRASRRSWSDVALDRFDAQEELFGDLAVRWRARRNASPLSVGAAGAPVRRPHLSVDQCARRADSCENFSVAPAPAMRRVRDAIQVRPQQQLRRRRRADAEPLGRAVPTVRTVLRRAHRRRPSVRPRRARGSHADATSRSTVPRSADVGLPSDGRRFTRSRSSASFERTLLPFAVAVGRVHGSPRRSAFERAMSSAGVLTWRYPFCGAL